MNFLFEMHLVSRDNEENYEDAVMACHLDSDIDFEKDDVYHVIIDFGLDNLNSPRMFLLNEEYFSAHVNSKPKSIHLVKNYKAIEVLYSTY